MSHERLATSWSPHEDECSAYSPLHHATQRAGNATRAKSLPSLPARSPFRYRKRTLGILLIYIPLLIVSWVLTCILSNRPITEPAYINQAGQYSQATVQEFQRAVTVSRVLTSIAALLTIPVISAVLAHATVVFTQRRTASQTLNADQMFALADRGWQNAVKMANVARRSLGRGHSDSSLFLWFGACVLVIVLSLLLTEAGALQQPLQQLLVSTEPIVLMTCNDVPLTEADSNATCNEWFSNSVPVGYDPEPQEIQFVPQNIVAQTVRQQIMTVAETEPQPNFWPEGQATYLNSSEVLNSIGSILNGIPSAASDANPLVRSFFVSSLPNGTTTGILRQHSMRLNTTVNCTHNGPPQLDRPCPGPRPFLTNFTQPGVLAISVCVPGAFDRSPWNQSRNRQDITEDIYIDVIVPGAPGNPLLIEDIITGNFSVHCSAATSRGYFELGNIHNGQAPGPLLEVWPSADELAANFNDEFPPALPNDPYADGNDWVTANQFDDPLNPDPFNINQADWMPTPGPLMTTALATFGNNSFFQAARANITNSSVVTLRQVCQPGALPFARLTWLESEVDYPMYCDGVDLMWQRHPADAAGATDTLSILMFQFANAFNQTPWATEAMYAGTFLANRALLTATVTSPLRNGLSRAISTSDGTTITIPTLSPATVVGLSVLLALQVLLLIGLAVYVYSVPTWTSELNARAIAKLACLQEPGAFGTFEDRARPKGRDQATQSMSGVIGIDETMEPSEKGEIRFTLGGSGIFPRARAAWRRK